MSLEVSIITYDIFVIVILTIRTAKQPYHLLNSFKYIVLFVSSLNIFSLFDNVLI